MIDCNYLDSASERGLCFFGYRIPGKIPMFGSAPVSQCINGIDKGFVIQPFDSSQHPITIPFQTFDGTEQLHISPLVDPFPSQSTAKAFYFKQTAQIIEYLKNKPNEKVVYSRVELHTFESTLSSAFGKLMEQYPNAYVFCFHTPSTGTWLGASPELLASCQGNKFETMALAGTMNAHRGGKWSQKNRDEQSIVADFIKAILKRKGITDYTERQGQLIAGPVKHLLTEFKFNLPRNLYAEEIVRDLSPTPALAGFPREKSLHIIAEHEAHDRGCYGGFCGPRFDESNFIYWVNLRCVQIKNSNCALYIGGGLMADSDPENEWKETERKALTLSEIINVPL